MNDKREKYINWQEYFMILALASSLRSKDPRCQVGCCIVDPNTHKVLSLGYNGFPRGINDDEFPWSKSSEKYSEQKFAYVVHAELNAILNADKSLNGAHMYVTSFPCNECCKAILQSGIEKIFYLNKYDEGSQSIIASHKMLDAAKIKVAQIEYSNPIIKYMQEYSESGKTITIK